MSARPIYLDHNGTTPLDPEVLDAMLPALRDGYGNASSYHVLGRAAAAAVDVARGHVAELVGAQPAEIVFTSGATEADNLAVLGVLRALSQSGHVLVSATEHKAVLGACLQATHEGHAMSLVRPERRAADGRILPDTVEAALRPDTALVSVMLGNNEIGVINPIVEIGERLADRGLLFHCDAAQGAGQIPLDVRRAKLDLLSMSAHKMYGPKGVGALYVRRGIESRLVALSYGGGHEFGLRAGTLNVPGIVGFGAACRIARDRQEVEGKRCKSMRDRLWNELHRRLPEVAVNGNLEHRLPGNLNVAFSFIDARELLKAIDGRICVSLGSACTSTSLEPSHVLRAIGVGNDRARSSVRFGIGRFTTESEVVAAVEIIVAEVERLREASPVVRVAKQAMPRPLGRRAEDAHEGGER